LGDTINYAPEFRETQISERLRWRCPAKTENYRPDISSGRAPHINKPKTVKKNNQSENGKNLSRVPGGCPTPGRTGRLTVSRNITLTSTADRHRFQCKIYKFQSVFKIYYFVAILMGQATQEPPTLCFSDCEPVGKLVQDLSTGRKVCQVFLLMTTTSSFVGEFPNVT
jgi:hypothetical protein